MKSDFNFFIVLTVLLLLSTGVPDVVVGQNDWGKPVHKELPPKFGKSSQTRYGNSNVQRPAPPAASRKTAQSQSASRTRGQSKPSAINLFGVRLAAAQDFGIEIDTGEEVSPEEIVTDEFTEDDIYYEDDAPTIAGDLLGDTVLNYDSGDSCHGDSCSGCADCVAACSCCGRTGRRCIRCRNGGLFVNGNGAYFMKPMWQTNPAFFVDNGAGLTAREFDWNTDFSPYAWVGIRGSSGLGLRGRFWLFDESASRSFIVPAGGAAVTPDPYGLAQAIGPGAVNALHEMKFGVSDIEFSFEKQNDAWGIETAAGVRYLDIEQSYSISSFDRRGRAQNLQSVHDFNGIGPTVFVKGNHGLGLFGLNVFASGRESILFGDRNTSVTNATITRDDKGQAVVSMTELELGLQRVVWLRRLGLDFQIAFVGQYWNGVGNASNGHFSASQRDQGMGFLGGRASLGVNF